MLALFLRVGCQYSGNDTLDNALRSFKSASVVDDDYDDGYSDDNQIINDANYLSRSHHFRRLIMTKQLSIFAPKMEDNYPFDDVDTIHDGWGIVSARYCDSFKTIWDLSGIEPASTQNV
jgi:hypothetical protein